jgi:hypothetical protein
MVDGLRGIAACIFNVTDADAGVAENFANAAT